MSNGSKHLEPSKMEVGETPRKDWKPVSVRFSPEDLELVDRVAFESTPRVTRTDLIRDAVMQDVRQRALALGVA